MPVKVVDASAFGALVFREPKAEQVAEVLAENALAAPTLLWYELSSICLKKLALHPKLRKTLLTAFDIAKRINIEIYDVDHSEVIDLAVKTEITTYDASYLWLAEYLHAELVTLDEEIRIAAESSIRR